MGHKMLWWGEAVKSKIEDKKKVQFSKNIDKNILGPNLFDLNFQFFFNSLCLSSTFSVFPHFLSFPQLSQFFLNFIIFPQLYQFFLKFFSLSSTFSVFPQLSLFFLFFLKFCLYVTFWKFPSHSKIPHQLTEGCGNRLSICQVRCVAVFVAPSYHISWHVQIEAVYFRYLISLWRHDQ